MNCRGNTRNYLCTLCNVNCATDFSYKSHNSGYKHSRRFLTKQNEYGFEKFSRIFGELPFLKYKYNSSSIKDAYLLHVDRSGILNKFNCRACNTKSRNINEWRRHVYNKQHQSKIYSLRGILSNQMFLSQFGDLPGQIQPHNEATMSYHFLTNSIETTDDNSNFSRLSPILNTGERDDDCSMSSASFESDSESRIDPSQYYERDSRMQCPSTRKPSARTSVNAHPFRIPPPPTLTIPDVLRQPLFQPVQFEQHYHSCQRITSSSGRRIESAAILEDIQRQNSSSCNGLLSIPVHPSLLPRDQLHPAYIPAQTSGSSCNPRSDSTFDRNYTVTYDIGDVCRRSTDVAYVIDDDTRFSHDVSRANRRSTVVIDEYSCTLAPPTLDVSRPCWRLQQSTNQSREPGSCTSNSNIPVRGAYDGLGNSEVADVALQKTRIQFLSDLVTRQPVNDLDDTDWCEMTGREREQAIQIRSLTGFDNLGQIRKAIRILNALSFTIL